MTVIQSYNSKNIPSGKLHAVKIAKANLPYVDVSEPVSKQNILLVLAQKQ